MTLRFQLVIDCADPVRQAAFWAAALGYVPEPPPPGHATWKAYYRSVGVPDEELVAMADEDTDSIVDPAAAGPRIWFQSVPDGEVVKNRLHRDIRVSDRGEPLRERRVKVDAEVQRLRELGATVLRVLAEPGMDHYGVTMHDPEGNEFC